MKRTFLGVVLSALCVGMASAEQPVHFGDEKLKAAVEAELWTSGPTPTDMLGLTSLNAGYEDITSVVGLEYATNLQSLVINWNQISDISPLAGLVSLEKLVVHGNPLHGISAVSGLINLRHLDIRETGTKDLSPLSGLLNLKELYAWGNGISNISILSGLAHLEILSLGYNKITDISTLSSLTGLRHLDLRENLITDISPLLGFTHLDVLHVQENPLNDAACASYIPQIEENNPGIELGHPPCGPRRLTVSSTAGGSVVEPGEGEFLYSAGDTVRLEAEADPDFVFTHWSGHSFSIDPVTQVTMDNDLALRANFAALSDVVHVDDDAQQDPGPNDSTRSDPGENGTSAHPVDSIAKAIEIARDGTTILVHAGTYHETIDPLGKRVKLTGFDPNDPNGAAWPVIDGDGAGPLVRFSHGEGPDCRLVGLVLTGGKARSGSRPTLANCLIVGNRATDSMGAVIDCTNSSPAFINCTIAENRAGQFGAGLHVVSGCPMITNSILWGNTPREILTDGDDLPVIRHSIVAGGWPGMGNLSADPLFAASGYWAAEGPLGVVVEPSNPQAVWVLGDYHVQSQAGRWDAAADRWVNDAVTSPAIDAGDPTGPVGREMSPNGLVINMGAYGGTAEASKSN